MDAKEQSDFVSDARVPGGWAGAGRVLVSFGSVVSDLALVGGSTDESFTGGGGDDTVDGGAGLDTMRYDKPWADFVITRQGADVSVRDRFAADGADTLVNVERVLFADGAMAFDVDGHAGQAFRLYKAAFDRAPDLPGLGYQMHALDTGLPLEHVASNFIASPEFSTRYGTLDNAEFITLLYRNVLDREPDAAGLQFHLHEMSAGESRALMLVHFSESPENQANVIASVADGILFTPLVY
jgi:hypothetical protein